MEEAKVVELISSILLRPFVRLRIIVNYSCFGSFFVKNLRIRELSSFCGAKDILFILINSNDKALPIEKISLIL